MFEIMHRTRVELEAILWILNFDTTTTTTTESFLFCVRTVPRRETQLFVHFLGSPKVTVVYYSLIKCV